MPILRKHFFPLLLLFLIVVGLRVVYLSNYLPEFQPPLVPRRSFVNAEGPKFVLGATLRSLPFNSVGCNPDVWRTYIRPEYYFLFKALRNDFGWRPLPNRFFGPQAHVHAMELLQLRPLAILFCENNVEHYTHLPIVALRRQGTIIAAFSDDLSMYNRYTRVFMQAVLLHTDVLIGTYAYRMKQFFEHLIDPKNVAFPKCIWLPHVYGSC